MFGVFFYIITESMVPTWYEVIANLVSIGADDRGHSLTERFGKESEENSIGHSVVVEEGLKTI